PAARLRRSPAHPRRRTAARDADRPRRRQRCRSFVGRRYPPCDGALLPADARLPGSLVARLADAPAEGDAPRPRRAAAGGWGRGLECPAGEPATALAAAVVPAPLADGAEELDAATTPPDAPGQPLLPVAGCPGPGRDGAADLRRLVD